VNPQSVGTESPAAGSVPHIYTKGATAYYSRAGWPVCGGGLGRPAVVPPAGRGGGVGRVPVGALGERRWGAFSESAEEGSDREDSFPAGRWLPGQGRRSQHGFLNRVDEGVDAAVCPRQFQKS
jgi:hypothetical protein